MSVLRQGYGRSGGMGGCTMMRFMSCGIILVFLLTAMHVMVDHGASGQHLFALLPHPCLSHTHDDDHPPTDHHDESGEPSHAHHPYQHQAETHSHFTGYPAAPKKSALDLAPGVLIACLCGMNPSVLGASALLQRPAPASPPRGLPVYLRCSVLLI